MRDNRPIHAHETPHKLPATWDDRVELALLTFILAAMPATVTAQALAAAGRLDASWIPGWVSSLVPPLFRVGVMRGADRG